MTASGSRSRLVSLLIFGGCAALLLVAVVMADIFIRVPDFSSLRKSVEVPIKKADGSESTKMVGPATPDWVPFSEISPYLAKAVVASEDSAFYQHQGIDVHEIQEALKKDLQEGHFARGASTLTQQVLKNVYLLHYPKIVRKIKEIAWAGALEQKLSKREILGFYLNMCEWGPGIYGAGHAARTFFGIPPSQLSPRQSAFLAMLLPAPRKYYAYFRKRQLTVWASKRVDRILEVMHRMNMLTEVEYQIAMNEQLWGKPVEPGESKDPGMLGDEEGEGYLARDSRESEPPKSELAKEPANPTTSEEESALQEEPPADVP